MRERREEYRAMGDLQNTDAIMANFDDQRLEPMCETVLKFYKTKQ